MILHTLNKAQSHAALNTQLFEVCSPEDSVILIEDGVYQLLAPKLFSSDDHWSFTVKNIYVLFEDALARGLDKKHIDPSLTSINFVNYEEFVALAARHTKTISWY